VNTSLGSSRPPLYTEFSRLDQRAGDINDSLCRAFAGNRPCPRSDDYILGVAKVRRHAELVAADAWATRNVALLAGCFGRFQADGEWPSLERLQHDFAIDSSPIEVGALSWKMPNALGFVEQERLVLRVRGMSHLSAAQPLLDDWYESLALAYRRWLEEGEAARVTRDDLVRILDDDLGRVRTVSLLLLRESWPFGSGQGGVNDVWSREVRSGVLAVRDAHTAADVLAARDAVEYPSDQFVKPPKNSRWRRPLRLISNNQLAAGVAAGVILAAGGAAIKLIPSGHEHGRGSGTSTGTILANGFAEQVGAGGARTYANPRALSGRGKNLQPMQYVRVRCRILSPDPPSVKPDGYWYRLVDGRYAPANSFWNGDVPGHKPYTHNTDFGVPDC
jgi:hypothetical protein